MFKLFEYKEGKLTTFPDLTSKKIKGVIFGSVFLIVIVILSGFIKINEKELWKLYNLIIQQFGLNVELPENQKQKQIEAKIELEVDGALRRYEEWESSLPPRMTNKTILDALESPRFSGTQRLIVKDAIYYECPGGVMGIRGAWVDKDPNCD